MHLGCTPTTIYMNSDFGLTGSGDPFVLKFSKITFTSLGKREKIRM
jgi:hypothetical protein